jgi:hypothetical protein
MPLSGGFDQPLASRTKDVSTVQLKLLTQLIDELLVLFFGLVVKLGRLIERRPEVLNLLRRPVQEVVTLAGISRP